MLRGTRSAETLGAGARVPQNSLFGGSPVILKSFIFEGMTREAWNGFLLVIVVWRA